MLAAGIILFSGFVLLFGLRQSYDPPPRDVQVSREFSAPPDALTPALAGALVTNGSPTHEHAMASIFSLAARGVVTIREDTRGLFKQRHFTIGRGSPRTLAPHEAATLDAIFDGEASADGRVELSKAHTRMRRQFSIFKDAVLGELGGVGLLDADRRRIQRRYFGVGGVLIALSLVAIAPLVMVIKSYGPWMAVIPTAIGLVGLVSFIYGAAHTPLSNEGVRRAEQWRAYQKYLREIAADGVRQEDWVVGTHSPADLLPIAVGLGLAEKWAALFKKRGLPLPAWFHAASTSDAHPAFIAFVGSGAGGHAHSGGGGGGGGAAGGGSSSAS